MKPLLIGIAGGSASGKSSIANLLKERFNDTNSVVIIKLDDYYNDQANMSMEERYEVNYDHPFAFDFDLLVADLQTLKQGKSIQKPVYDFINYTRSSYYETIHCNDVILLEGLLILDEQRLRDLMDIKVFVDAPADIRFIRRLKRDVKNRGRNLDDVVEQYLSTVRVMHEQFIEPSKRHADIIIPEGAKNSVAIDLLTTKIGSIIDRSVI